MPAVVVEKHAGTSIQPKARRFNFRTMEIFRSLGIASDVYRAAEGLARYEGMRAGRTLAVSEPLPPPPHIDYGALATISPESSCLVAQDLLEPVLLDLARRRGVDVRFRTQLLDLDQDGAGVIARLRNDEDGAQRTVRSEYLIGADGAHSTVRELLGIGTSGRGTLGEATTVCFEADLSELVVGREFNLCQIDHANAPGALASIDGRYRWMFLTGPLLPVPDDGVHPSPAQANAWAGLIRAALGVSDMDIMITSVLGWQSAMRVADRYADRRALLAGDAAHVMTPYAALGANTGIQDAANLAWKIAAIRSGYAGPDLLHSYDQERRPVGYRAAEQSALRTGGLGSAVDPALDHPLALVVAQQYTAGAVLDDGSGPQPMDRLELTGRPGTRLPHLPLADGSSTLDAVGKRLTLLPGPNAVGWIDAAHDLGVPACVPGSDWPRAAGIRPDGALLVRPDHVVAWRSATATSDPINTLAGVIDSIRCLPVGSSHSR